MHVIAVVAANVGDSNAVRFREGSSIRRVTLRAPRDERAEHGDIGLKPAATSAGRLAAAPLGRDSTPSPAATP
jgi:hypothetical protein